MNDYRSYVDDHYALEVRASEQQADLGRNTDKYHFLRVQQSGGPGLAAMVRQTVIRLEYLISKWRCRLAARTRSVRAVEPCS